MVISCLELCCRSKILQMIAEATFHLRKLTQKSGSGETGLVVVCPTFRRMHFNLSGLNSHIIGTVNQKWADSVCERG